MIYKQYIKSGLSILMALALMFSVYPNISWASTVNQIDNGDFQNGDTGFTTQYINNAVAGTTAETGEGEYEVRMYAQLAHSAWTTKRDHTYGNDSGLYFIANGASETTKSVWQSSAVTIEAGTNYRFEAYVTTVYPIDGDTAPSLMFEIGDGNTWVSLGETYTFPASVSGDSVGEWHLSYTDCKFSNSGTYYVRLRNLQTAGGGNDFGIDDIWFSDYTLAPSIGTTPNGGGFTEFDTSSCLTMNLHEDTGTSTEDHLTSNGQIDVTVSNSWQYSINSGSSWTDGVDTNFTLVGDGIKTVIVRQDNGSGSWLDPSAPLTFTLDTSPPTVSSESALASEVQIQLSETLIQDSVPVASDFEVTIEGGSAQTPTVVSISGDTVTLTIADIIGINDVSVAYTQPVGEVALKGPAGNKVASFSKAIPCYEVSYNLGTSTSGTTPNSQGKQPGVNISVANNTGNLDIEHYEFDVWNTQSDGNGSNYTEGGAYAVDADVILYPKWTASDYAINYNDTKAVANANPTTYTIETATITLSDLPDTTGYIFDSWSEGNTLTIGSTGDKTYTAIWTPLTYTVTFDENDGIAGNVITETATYGTALPSVSASGNLPTRSGYRFTGYYSEVAGGVKYYNGDGTSAKDWDIDSDTTLYARWQVISSSSSNRDEPNTELIVVAGIEEEGDEGTIGVVGTMVVSPEEVTVTVDEASMQKSILLAEEEAVVKVVIPKLAKEISTTFTVQDVADMQEKNLIISIETDKAIYTLPTREIDLTVISDSLGETVALKDVEFEVIQKDSSDTMEKIILRAAEGEKVEILMPSIDFEIKAKYMNKVVEVDKFKNYVTRKVAIPSGVDASKITTATVSKDGKVIAHVPTYVEEIDGVYYAVINSLTNSTYTLIYNNESFDDIDMWAKNTIENITSRLIMEGDTSDTFNPNRLMTRGEFVTSVVKALGLLPVDYVDYEDMDMTMAESGYVQTSREYGLTMGVGNGLFVPDEIVSRKEAMAILKRVAELIEYEGIRDDVDMDQYLDYKGVIDYADDAVRWNVRNNIVEGRSANILALLEGVTKAEAATVIERMLKKVGLIQ